MENLRNHLMKFEQNINEANVRFTRVDTLKVWMFL